MSDKIEPDIAKKVSKLYSMYPFPGIPIKNKEDLYKTQIYRLVYFLIKKYLNKTKPRTINIIDAGCGTGELMLAIAEPRMHITAIDKNKKSIKKAQEKANSLNMEDITFKEQDIFDPNLPDNYFDFTFSIGVLHHLKDPESGFKRLVKTTKKNGYITIGVYNPYGRIWIRLKRKLIQLLAGEDIEKRVQLAKKLFYRRDLESHEEIFIADLYAHPHEKYISFESLLKWFESNNIEYLECTPPIELSKNINMIIQLLKGDNQDMIAAWQKISNKDIKVHRWERISFLTILTQIFWMIIGKGQFITITGIKR